MDKRKLELSDFTCNFLVLGSDLDREAIEISAVTKLSNATLDAIAIGSEIAAAARTSNEIRAVHLPTTQPLPFVRSRFHFGMLPLLLLASSVEFHSQQSAMIHDSYVHQLAAATATVT